MPQDSIYQFFLKNNVNISILLLLFNYIIYILEELYNIIYNKFVGFYKTLTKCGTK